MKSHQDAFGHALLDYLKGRGSLVDFVKRDDRYLDVSENRNTYLADYERRPAHHKHAMRYVRGNVLDIGCGAGRHSLYLQRKGFSVLGRFDTVLMLGANFGLFENFEKAKWLLRRLHSATVEKARIVAESRDPYKTTEPFHLTYHRLNRSRGRMAGQVRIRVRYKKYATPWFDYLFVSRNEMRKILEGTGWKVSRFLFSKGPMYIAVIQKQSRTIDA
ncbi:MAG: hypothetical protein ACT4PY_11895 [Armatimonadota bacterium]